MEETEVLCLLLDLVKCFILYCLNSFINNSESWSSPNLHIVLTFNPNLDKQTADNLASILGESANDNKQSFSANKRIEIDLSHQKLYAYDGDNLEEEICQM